MYFYKYNDFAKCVKFDILYWCKLNETKNNLKTIWIINIMSWQSSVTLKNINEY